MIASTSLDQLANLLKLIAAPTRLAILLTLGEGEACVCHLEAMLGKRQAAISQHLMALRRANILLDRREGRFVYYRLADRAVLDLVRDAGRLVEATVTPAPASVRCSCPSCAGQSTPLTLETASARVTPVLHLLPV